MLSDFYLNQQMSRAQESSSNATCRNNNSKALNVYTISLLWKTVKSTTKWVYEKPLTWVQYIIDYVLRWDYPLFIFQYAYEMKIAKNLFSPSAI